LIGFQQFVIELYFTKVKGFVALKLFQIKNVSTSINKLL